MKLVFYGSWYPGIIGVARGWEEFHNLNLGVLLRIKYAEQCSPWFLVVLVPWTLYLGDSSHPCLHSFAQSKLTPWHVVSEGVELWKAPIMYDLHGILHAIYMGIDSICFWSLTKISLKKCHVCQAFFSINCEMVVEWWIHVEGYILPLYIPWTIVNTSICVHMEMGRSIITMHPLWYADLRLHTFETKRAQRWRDRAHHSIAYHWFCWIWRTPKALSKGCTSYGRTISRTPFFGATIASLRLESLMDSRDSVSERDREERVFVVCIRSISPVHRI